jgi:hypothetical protein
MADEIESTKRALNHLLVGVTNGITPEAVKRILIAHWPTPSIPDLTEIAGQVCLDLHRLIVETGDRQAPLDFAALSEATPGSDNECPRCGHTVHVAVCAYDGLIPCGCSSALPGDDEQDADNIIDSDERLLPRGLR